MLLQPAVFLLFDSKPGVPEAARLYRLDPASQTAALLWQAASPEAVLTSKV